MTPRTISTIAVFVLVLSAVSLASGQTPVPPPKGQPPVLLASGQPTASPANGQPPVRPANGQEPASPANGQPTASPANGPSTFSPATSQAPNNRVKGSYVIGPQDVLSIAVWDQADLSGKFTVETDGSFTFPLIGRIAAAGLTLRDLETQLRKRLTDGYFKNPQISVTVEQYRSQRIFVIGEVRAPGAFPLTGDMTLIEALARAGSTTVEAAGEAVISRPPAGKATTAPVLPNEDQAAEVIRVNIRDLQSGKASQNITLQDGDTIYVPRAETIYVFGQVKSPGAYPLKSLDTTVLQALSLAGGITDRGSTNRIRIVRLVDGQKKELKAKLGDPVKPGDTIIVRERFF